MATLSGSRTRKLSVSFVFALAVVFVSAKAPILITVTIDAIKNADTLLNILHLKTGEHFASIHYFIVNVWVGFKMPLGALRLRDELIIFHLSLAIFDFSPANLLRSFSATFV